MFCLTESPPNLNIGAFSVSSSVIATGENATAVRCSSPISYRRMNPEMKVCSRAEVSLEPMPGHGGALCSFFSGTSCSCATERAGFLFRRTFCGHSTVNENTMYKSSELNTLGRRLTSPDCPCNRTPRPFCADAVIPGDVTEGRTPWSGMDTHLLGSRSTSTSVGPSALRYGWCKCELEDDSLTSFVFIYSFIMVPSHQQQGARCLPEALM